MSEKHLRQTLYFLLLVILIVDVDFTFSLKNKHRPCKQEGPCKCVFVNGTKVDISELTNYTFGWVPVTNTSEILYSPCVDVKNNETSSNACSDGVSICLRNVTNTTKTYVSLGKADEGKFSDKTEEPVSIQFGNGQTSVHLICDQNLVVPKLTAKLESSLYVLELASLHSCLTENESTTGFSTGSVLVLMFFVLSFVYFGGGMLTLKLLRGAEGKEMIPNYEFWADLPYLVRDGILFTLSGFQSSPSYDRI